ncbi:MAG: hypothetical protein WC438_00305 [Candidatus Pacearchaeota archaeon]
MKNKLNKLIEDKGAQAHVEMILSITLFVGFLVFIFIILNPFGDSKNASFIGNVERAVMTNITENFGKLSIIMDVANTCYSSIPPGYPGNYQGKKINDRLYHVYFSDSFSNNLGCTGPDGTYSIGTFSNEEIVSYDNLQKLKTNYENEYNRLRTSLGLGNEFTFTIRTLEGLDIGLNPIVKNPPKGVNVEAKDIPIRVINSSGDISELILNIKAW